MSDAGATQPGTPAATEPREPRTARGRRTREALLEAALQEFGQKGFHATGITDITRRAGVALGSFYTWFDSKEAIYRAVIAHLTQALRDHVAPRLAQVEGAINREKAALAAFMAFIGEN
ncbi:MAG: TetR/AcrR family transcriptional regulator, partial [Sphingomonadaceae bacterium]